MSSLTLQKHFLVWVRVTSHVRKEEGSASIIEIYILKETIHQDLYRPTSRLNFISKRCFPHTPNSKLHVQSEAYNLEGKEDSLGLSKAIK